MKINNTNDNPLVRAAPASAPTPANKVWLTPGREALGEVIARLEEGAYLVKVAGELFSMQIPMDLEPGSSLRLTFGGSQPRPTFLLSDQAGGRLTVSLSETATTLKEAAAGIEAGKTGASIFRSSPLAEANTVDPRSIAASLRDAVAFSGLFYESHLLQWFQGELPFAEILKELRYGRPPRARQGTSDDRGAAPSPYPPGLDEGPTGRVPATDLSPPDCLEDKLGPSANMTPPMVREQLELLLSGSLTWRGEFLPGQEMEWSLEREPDGADPEAGPRWRTSLRLNLDNLGPIRAALSFTAEGVEGTVRAERPGTAEILKRELGQLEERLGASGIPLSRLEIECGE